MMPWHTTSHNVWCKLNYRSHCFPGGSNQSTWQTLQGLLPQQLSAHRVKR
ncbi:hypothetical protein Hanom_Chr07g00602481 [Helianthus anomalus]